MSKLNAFVLAATSFAAFLPAGAAHAADDLAFETDVGAAIDAGLQWFRNNNVFTSATYNASRPMAVLALLEKRASVDPDAEILGYVNSATADQGLLRQATHLILRTTSYGPNGGLYTYGAGEALMSLSLYARTGGPDVGGHADLPAAGCTAGRNCSLRQAIDYLTNLTINGQTTTGLNSGFWGYNGGGDDSSTTQFAVAGLAAAKAFYNTMGDPTARVAAIDTTLARTRSAYATNLRVDGGFGYRRTGYTSSYQQTASALWCSLLGGANVNDVSAQRLLNWQLSNYNYQTVYAAYNSWPASYYYYLWSSSKAYTLITDAEIAPGVGNETPEDLGTLPLANITLDRGDFRLPSRNYLTDPPARGGGAAGKYAHYRDDELKPRWYYDYAYTLMKQQDAAGYFNASSFRANGTIAYNHGAWNNVVNQAYAILVLERSLGGACADNDGDGHCDDEDNCPAVSNSSQTDGDGDGDGDACDNCAAIANADQANADGDARGNVCDNCPGVANNAQTDTDGDGLGDSCDECPEQAAGASPDPTRPGCPGSRPPVADARPDGATYECVDQGAEVTLDGSNSSDPDGDALTYSWAPAAGLDDPGAEWTSGFFPKGAYSYTLTVDDGVFSDDDAASFSVVDTAAPVVTCSDAAAECAGALTDVAIGGSADDACDGDLAVSSDHAGGFALGDTDVTFSATDDEGHSASATCTASVVDSTAPVVTLNGGAVTLECGDAYVEQGATALDLCEGELPVTISGVVDGSTPGDYTVTYSAEDSTGNTDAESRPVEVLKYFDAENSVLWHQPIARNGMSDDSDPSLQADGDPSTNLKYRFGANNTIPVQIHVLDKWGNDVTANQATSASVTVYTDMDCDGVVEGGDVSVSTTYNGVGGMSGSMSKVSDTDGTHLKYNLNCKSLPSNSGCFILEVTSRTSGSCNDTASERVLLQRR